MEWWKGRQAENSEEVTGTWIRTDIVGIKMLEDQDLVGQATFEGNLFIHPLSFLRLTTYFVCQESSKCQGYRDEAWFLLLLF